MHNISPQRNHWFGSVGMRWLFGKRRARWTATHRHKKGGEYRVLGQGVLEADRSDVVIYDDADGTIWVRDAGEFHDGRFTKIA